MNVKVTQSCPILCDSMDYTVHGILQPEYWSGYPFPSSGDLPNLEIKPRSPALQADSLPAEPQGKPENTGVCSLSLLQRIFPIQELNRGLMKCKWILYQLSYQESLRDQTWSFLDRRQILYHLIHRHPKKYL